MRAEAFGKRGLTWLDRPRKSEDVEDERFSRGLAGRIAARSAFSASVMMPPSGLVTWVTTPFTRSKAQQHAARCVHALRNDS